MDPTFLNNLDVLIAAVEACAGDRINLDAKPDGPVTEWPVSVVGLLLRMAHFRRLGVVPLATSGEPSMIVDGGMVVSRNVAFRRLFGRFDGIEAIDAFGKAYGRGVWDEILVDWFACPPSDRQLALARLLYGREVFKGFGEARPPLRMPERIRVALRLPAVLLAEEVCVANLQALRDAILELRTQQVTLQRYRRRDTSEPFCVAGLVANLNRFRECGVCADPILGLPLMQADDGSTMSPMDCLNHFFGCFGRQEAYDAIFRAYGEGAWDRTLMKWFVTRPSDKQLVLARIGFALALAAGDASIAPDPTPPKACAELLAL